ncbi:DUF5985 family protein [Massilia sp. CF038]|uniref:DUF5985 family protein n=1 Tax=Massilia sp. CF038 TaxID=1881045 RepID=UPI000922C5F6|nr:DUF5985 family protein [Massilia sp. CF038]SHG74120.1 hypothetical protein SAMN05428948_1843 [Massilia sp. CF038]
MAITIYLLCALTALCCAFLLLLSYRRTGHRVLFWSGLCFVGMTVNNVLLICDKVVFPTTIDLLPWRLISALVAVALLLYGLIDEKE